MFNSVHVSAAEMTRPRSMCAHHHHHHHHQRVCGGERQIRSSGCSQMFTDFDGCSRPATLGVDVGVVPVRLGPKSARMLSTIPSSTQRDSVCRPITTLLRQYMCACVVAPDHQDWPHDANAPDGGWRQPIINNITIITCIITVIIRNV